MADVPAWLAALGAIVPAASGMAGYWLAARNDEARDLRAAERDERASLAAKTERLEDERQAFQREVLLELQDRLVDLNRATVEAMVAYQRALDDRGQVRLPEAASAGLHEARLPLTRARERVLNDELRRELRALEEFTADVQGLSLGLRGAAVTEAENQLTAITEEHIARWDRVNEILGRELRAVLGRSAAASGLLVKLCWSADVGRAPFGLARSEGPF